MRIADLAQRPSDGRLAACRQPSIRWGFYYNGVGWVRIFLAESQSRLYPHMHALFGAIRRPSRKKLPFNFISRFACFALFGMIRFWNALGCILFRVFMVSPFFLLSHSTLSLHVPSSLARNVVTLGLVH